MKKQDKEKIKKKAVKLEARPVGRPTIYDPKYCELLIAHMKSGLSFECFGAAVGVARDRVYEWANKHPEFAEAKKIAHNESLLFWEKAGLNGLWHGGGKNPQFNSSVWIFNVKNRFGWKDKSEHSLVENKPFTLAYDPRKSENNNETSDN